MIENASRNGRAQKTANITIEIIKATWGYWQASSVTRFVTIGQVLL